MSTKSTIKYGHNFHLYHDMVDDDHVYLRIEGTEFEASPGSVTVAIPDGVWDQFANCHGNLHPMKDDDPAIKIAKLTSQLEMIKEYWPEIIDGAAEDCVVWREVDGQYFAELGHSGSVGPFKTKREAVERIVEQIAKRS